MRTTACALACLGLAACATGYQEENFLTGGVHAQRIDDQTAIISSRGNGYTSASTVQVYVMRTAAEETKADGFDWFEISGVQDATRHGAITTPGFYNSTTTANTYGSGNSAYGSASTTGYYNPGTTINYTKPGVEIVIHMHKGEKPAEVRGFVASSVLAYTAPKKG